MGSAPKITRALIGDVAIEMTPGTGTEPLPVGETAAKAPLVEGEVAADPSKMMASAAETLAAIQEAAKGLGGIAKKAERADELIATFIDTGKSLGSASNRLDTILKEGGGEIGPTMTNLRATSDRLNKALDDKTVAEFRTAIAKISAAGTKLDASLTDLKPLLADLGAPVNVAPTTNFGQAVWRANRVFSDVGAPHPDPLRRPGRAQPQRRDPAALPQPRPLRQLEQGRHLSQQPDRLAPTRRRLDPQPRRPPEPRSLGPYARGVATLIHRRPTEPIMGVALFIVTAREVEGLDTFVDGKALAHVDDLDGLARAACVPALMDFFSQSPDDLLSLFGEEGDDGELHLPEGTEAPPVEWFDADAGLATVRGLLRLLTETPRRSSRPAAFPPTM